MNRTQKKCFLASAGFHLLLLLILFIGPAFLTSRDKEAESRQLLEFIPFKTLDEVASGGGSPNARPPEPAPPPAASPPKPETQPKQIEQPDPPKPAQRDPDTFNDKPPVKKLPKVNTTKVTRSKVQPAAKQKQAVKSNSQADDSRAQLARAAQNAVSNLRQSFSSSTTVEMPGPGGGGVPYANFLDAVRKIYSDAWLVPDGVTDDSAVATASVTIARDGTVLDARIIVPSGNALADQSVEAVLRRVTAARPLPETAKESQRTVKIKFSVKAKLLG